MNIDKFGTRFISTNEIVGLLYRDPNINLTNFKVTDPDQYNQSVRELYADMPILERYTEFQGSSVEEFDRMNQNKWHIPKEYQDFDIAKWCLDQCGTEEELQRVGKELLLFQERNLFDLLKFLKYMVDTLRANNVVWGVGRGSSVASYVLFLIGVHKIDSLYYDLPIEEFLK